MQSMIDLWRLAHPDQTAGKTDREIAMMMLAVDPSVYTRSPEIRRYKEEMESLDDRIRKAPFDRHTVKSVHDDAVSDAARKEEDRSWAQTYLKDPVTRGILMAQLSDVTMGAASAKEGQTMDAVGEIVRIRKKMREMEVSPHMKEYQDARGLWKSGSELFGVYETPAIVGEVVMESMAALLHHGWSRVGAGAATGAGMAAVGGQIGPQALAPEEIITVPTGALIGAAVGIGKTSYNLAYTQKYLDILEETVGPEVMDDRELLYQAINDPQTVAKARSKAGKYAIPIAIFDTISVGLAGRATSAGRALALRASSGAAALPKTGIANQAARLGYLGTSKVAPMGVSEGFQMAAGMLGEAGGQKFSEGKIHDWKGVVLEGIAELGMAPFDLTIGHLTRDMSPEHAKALNDAIRRRGGLDGKPRDGGKTLDAAQQKMDVDAQVEEGSLAEEQAEVYREHIDEVFRAAHAGELPESEKGAKIGMDKKKALKALNALIAAELPDEAVAKPVTKEGIAERKSQAGEVEGRGPHIAAKNKSTLNKFLDQETDPEVREALLKKDIDDGGVKYYSDITDEETRDLVEAKREISRVTPAQAEGQGDLLTPEMMKDVEERLEGSDLVGARKKLVGNRAFENEDEGMKWLGVANDLDAMMGLAFSDGKIAGEARDRAYQVFDENVETDNPVTDAEALWEIADTFEEADQEILEAYSTHLKQVGEETGRRTREEGVEEEGDVDTPFAKARPPRHEEFPFMRPQKTEEEGYADYVGRQESWNKKAGPRRAAAQTKVKELIKRKAAPEMISEESDMIEFYQDREIETFDEWTNRPDVESQAEVKEVGEVKDVAGKLDYLPERLQEGVTEAPIEEAPPLTTEEAIAKTKRVVEGIEKEQARTEAARGEVIEGKLGPLFSGEPEEVGGTTAKDQGAAVQIRKLKSQRDNWLAKEKVADSPEERRLLNDAITEINAEIGDLTGELPVERAEPHHGSPLLSPAFTSELSTDDFGAFAGTTKYTVRGETVRASPIEMARRNARNWGFRNQGAYGGRAWEWAEDAFFHALGEARKKVISFEGEHVGKDITGREFVENIVDNFSFPTVIKNKVMDLARDFKNREELAGEQTFEKGTKPRDRRGAAGTEFIEKSETLIEREGAEEYVHTPTSLDDLAAEGPSLDVEKFKSSYNPLTDTLYAEVIDSTRRTPASIYEKGRLKVRVLKAIKRFMRKFLVLAEGDVVRDKEGRIKTENQKLQKIHLNTVIMQDVIIPFLAAEQERLTTAFKGLKQKRNHLKNIKGQIKRAAKKLRKINGKEYAQVITRWIRTASSVEAQKLFKPEVLEELLKGETPEIKDAKTRMVHHSKLVPYSKVVIAEGIIPANMVDSVIDIKTGTFVDPNTGIERVETYQDTVKNYMAVLNAQLKMLRNEEQHTINGIKKLEAETTLVKPRPRRYTAMLAAIEKEYQRINGKRMAEGYPPLSFVRDYGKTMRIRRLRIDEKMSPLLRKVNEAFYDALKHDPKEGWGGYPKAIIDPEMAVSEFVEEAGEAGIFAKKREVGAELFDVSHPLVAEQKGSMGFYEAFDILYADLNESEQRFWDRFQPLFRLAGRIDTKVSLAKLTTDGIAPAPPALYDPVTDQIIFDPTGAPTSFESTKILMEEYLHALTATAIVDHPFAGVEIKKVLAEAQLAYKKRGKAFENLDNYFLHNEFELMAHAMFDEKVQRFLNSVPTSGRNLETKYFNADNLLAKVLGILRKVLGIPAKHGSLLEEVLTFNAWAVNQKLKTEPLQPNYVRRYEGGRPMGGSKITITMVPEVVNYDDNIFMEPNDAYVVEGKIPVEVKAMTDAEIAEAMTGLSNMFGPEGRERGWSRDKESDNIPELAETNTISEALKVIVAKSTSPEFVMLAKRMLKSPMFADGLDVELKHLPKWESNKAGVNVPVRGGLYSEQVVYIDSPSSEYEISAHASGKRRWGGFTSAQIHLHEIAHALTSSALNKIFWPDIEGGAKRLSREKGGMNQFIERLIDRRKAGKKLTVGEEAAVNLELIRRALRLLDTAEVEGESAAITAAREKFFMEGVGSLSDISNVPYALTNIDELIAEAFSEQGVRDILNSIKVSELNLDITAGGFVPHGRFDFGGLTVWEALVKLVSDLMGLSENESTVLEEIMRQSERIMGLPAEEHVGPLKRALTSEMFRALPYGSKVKGSFGIVSLDSVLSVEKAWQKVKDYVGEIVEVDLSNTAVGRLSPAQVFHGTPNPDPFEKFSTDHIGEGEDATMAGWGLYFTDRKEVGEHYRDMRKRYNFDHDLGHMVEEDPNLPKGKVYEVELAPEESEYLLWDKPFRQQSDKVKKALRKISKTLMPPTLARDYSKTIIQGDATGKAVYLRMVESLGNAFLGQRSKEAELATKKEVSLLLLKHGIRGNKFRGQGGKGGFNYVIFNDADVSIDAIFAKPRKPIQLIELIPDLENVRNITEALDIISEQAKSEELVSLAKALRESTRATLAGSTIPIEFLTGKQMKRRRKEVVLGFYDPTADKVSIGIHMEPLNKYVLAPDDTVYISRQDAGLFLHEIAHAVTAKAIAAVREKRGAYRMPLTGDSNFIEAILKNEVKASEFTNWKTKSSEITSGEKAVLNLEFLRRAISGTAEVGDRRRTNILPKSFQSEYGLTNVEELIAEAYSNPSFRAVLKGIKISDLVLDDKASIFSEGIFKQYPEGSASAWDALVALVSQLLGLSKNESTVLEEVMRQSSALMELPVEEHRLRSGQQELFAKPRVSSSVENTPAETVEAFEDAHKIPEIEQGLRSKDMTMWERFKENFISKGEILDVLQRKIFSTNGIAGKLRLTLAQMFELQAGSSVKADRRQQKLLDDIGKIIGYGEKVAVDFNTFLIMMRTRDRILSDSESVNAERIRELKGRYEGHERGDANVERLTEDEEIELSFLIGNTKKVGDFKTAKDVPRLMDAVSELMEGRINNDEMLRYQRDAEGEIVSDVNGPLFEGKFVEAMEKYSEHMQNGLYDLFVAGVLSPPTYQRIQSSTDLYVPFYVMKYFERNPEDTFGKFITGIEQEDLSLLPAMDAGTFKLYNIQLRVDRNIFMKKLDTFRKDFDPEGNFVKKLDKAEADKQSAIRGWDKVRFYDNGNVTYLVMDKDVANLLNSHNPVSTTQSYMVAKMLGDVFKLGATGINVFFQLGNFFLLDPVRLLTTSKAGLRARNKGFGPVVLAHQYFKAMASSLWANMTPNSIKNLITNTTGITGYESLYDEFVNSGAAGATIAEYMAKPSRIKDPLSAHSGSRRNPLVWLTAKMSQPGKVLEQTAKMVGLQRMKIFDGIDALADKIDKTKDAGKKRALQNLMQEKMDAIAVEIRNYAGSPDFMRKGRVTEFEALNVLFMFFNARVQGVERDMTRLFKVFGGDAQDRKLALMTALKLSSFAAMPTMLAWSMNRRDKDREDDYDELSDTDKRHYIHLPLGEKFKHPYIEGKMVADYIRIPRRESIGLFSFTMEKALDWLYEKDPDAVSEMVSYWLESTMPVNVEGVTELKPVKTMQSVFSSMNPIVKAPMEQVGNMNFFRHKPIVPQSYLRAAPQQQYFETTPDIYKLVAGIHKELSPLRIKHFVETITAGGITQLMPPKEVGAGPSWGREIASTRLISRLARSTYIDETDLDEILNDENMHDATARVIRRRGADKFMKETEGMSVQDRVRHLRPPTDNNTKLLNDLIIRKLREQVLGLEPDELRMKNSSVNVRSSTIVRKIQGMSPAQVKVYLTDLAAKKILTRDVANDFVMKLQQRGESIYDYLREPVR